MKNTNRKMDFANDKINNLVKKLIYNLHLVDIILFHSSQVNYFPDIRIYIHQKNTIFNNRNKHRNKNNCNSSNQR